MPRILVLSQPFPSGGNPAYGVHVFNRYRAISRLPDFEVEIVSPSPFWPRALPIGRYASHTNFPAVEELGGLRVHRPRFPAIPVLGKHMLPRLMWRSVARTVTDLEAEGAFDLIDANWVYPMGPIAVDLARSRSVPVVMTEHGSDLPAHARLLGAAGVIRETLRGPGQLVSVSQFMTDHLVRLGASADRIALIPNGFDPRFFRPGSRVDARRKLGLPTDQRILLSIGELTENKGFHILVQALPTLLDEGHDVSLAIVGVPPPFGPSARKMIQREVERVGLAGRVVFIGPQTHADLARWYCAADLFALLSSREGASCVLVESLACGTPVVATNAGNAVQLLTKPDRGILVERRTAEDASRALLKALDSTWDQAKTSASVAQLSWEALAQQTAEVYARSWGSLKGSGKSAQNGLR